MIIRCLAWPSSEQSQTLTPSEVAQLADVAEQLASPGQLSDGKYIGATKALYWQRLAQGD